MSRITILSPQIFEGECIPSLTELEKQFLSKDDNVYPHAWKGGIGCFVLGLAIMVFTVLLALLTPCCRTCLCCSVFTVSEVRRSAMLDTCLSVLRVCSNVRSRPLLAGTARLSCWLEVSPGHRHLWTLWRLHPRQLPHRGSLLDGRGRDHLHGLGQLPHGVRLQVDQEHQDD